MRTSLAVLFMLSAVAGAAHAQNTEHTVMQHDQMDHAAHMKMMADTQRQADVAQRGKDVMPFSVSATTHIFTKNAAGGIQQVVAKNPRDTQQIELIRQHLRTISEQFMKGDFSGPGHIHGQNMPGLKELANAKPGQLDIAYTAVPAGAQLTYTSNNAALITALHNWFDAQLSDHGNDAVAEQPPR
jgi:hypothetical protein